MQTVKRFGKVAAGVAIAGALLGGGATAHADAGENVTSVYGLQCSGSAYSYWVYSWSSLSNGNENVAVRDGCSDGNGVYSLYDRVNDHGLRLDNSSGYGTTKYSGNSTSNYVQKVTACINIPLTPDQCGPDDRPGDGR
ncbi:hypothetical protein [Streptomyces sp. NBC_01477]|uniref:hypothetical protein n=1 Tax=Streptomyces sp. NBC_01477 TaxID=2976015 RepID=UPI002E2EE1E5|nr:hypothetical protein [Streptomyces sp. NBC_01477]